MDEPCLLNRIIWGICQSHMVHRSLYKTSMGNWTENRNEAEFKPWNGTDGNLCCQVKYQEYCQLGKHRFNTIDDARAFLHSQFDETQIIDLLSSNYVDP